jgi:lysozyme family protein
MKTILLIATSLLLAACSVQAPPVPPAEPVVVETPVTPAPVVPGRDIEAEYARIMNHVFRHEGGWFNHPNDPGGATMYGITIHDVRRYINPSAQPADVRRITRTQAAAIYRERYWNAVRGDELPAGLNQTVMDLGVNSGVGRARSFMRRAVGLNGVMVPFTDREIQIINERARNGGNEALIRHVNEQRRRFVRALGIYAHFGRGWERRITFVLNDSLRMARGLGTASFGDTATISFGGGRAMEDGDAVYH